MSEYSHSIEIDAPGDEVFQFVSQPENLPRILPTLREAHGEGSGEIHIMGNAKGHPYSVTGEFHVNPDDRTMTWAAEHSRKYHGELTVAGDQPCSVSVALNFEPGERTEQKIQQQEPEGQEAIQRALVESLQTLKQICEGAAVGQSRGYMS